MGGKKKSSSKKKVQPSPAKYVAAPVEPVKTRSASSKAESVTPVDTPTSRQLPDAAATAPAGLSLATIQKSLEDRFDERMARMETNSRSSIASAISAAVPIGVRDDTPSSMPPPAVPAPQSSRAVGRESTRSLSRSLTRSISSRVSRSTSSRSSRSSTRLLQDIAIIAIITVGPAAVVLSIASIVLHAT